MPLSPSLPAFNPQLDLFVDFYTQAGVRTLDALRRLNQLNLQLARDLIAEAGTNTQRILQSRDAAQLNNALCAAMAPGTNAFYHYQRQLGDILVLK